MKNKKIKIKMFKKIIHYKKKFLIYILKIFLLFLFILPKSVSKNVLFFIFYIISKKKTLKINQILYKNLKIYDEYSKKIEYDSRKSDKYSRKSDNYSKKRKNNSIFIHKIWKHIINVFVNAFFFANMSKKNILKMIQFSQPIEEVCFKDEATFYISAHFGNWELFPHMMKKCGYNSYFIYKPAKNKLLAQIIYSIRTGTFFKIRAGAFFCFFRNLSFFKYFTGFLNNSKYFTRFSNFTSNNNNISSNNINNNNISNNNTNDINDNDEMFISSENSIEVTKNILKAFASKRSIGMLVDQLSGSNQVEFMGKNIFCSYTPFVLAFKYKIPIVLCYNIQKKNKYFVFFKRYEFDENNNFYEVCYGANKNILYKRILILYESMFCKNPIKENDSKENPLKENDSKENPLKENDSKEKFPQENSQKKIFVSQNFVSQNILSNQDFLFHNTSNNKLLNHKVPNHKSLNDKIVNEIAKIIYGEIEKWIMQNPEQWMWFYDRWTNDVMSENE